MSLECLKILREAMRTHDETVCDEHGNWRTDLPTFGGEVPTDADTWPWRAWSWDRDYLLVGPCADDLWIMERPS